VGDGMDFIMVTEQALSNYTSEIIGVCATLGGTVLGWLLGMISNNMGKMQVYVDKYEDNRSNKKEYACISKIFVCNSTNKQQCLRNVRLEFRDEKNKSLFEAKVGCGTDSFETVRSHNENILGIVKINGMAQEEFDISRLIDGENYKKLSNAKAIYLKYEDLNNHTKSVLIKSGFELDNVEKSKTDRFL
jgi:phage-related tail fiber protein